MKVPPFRVKSAVPVRSIEVFKSIDAVKEFCEKMLEYLAKVFTNLLKC